MTFTPADIVNSFNLEKAMKKLTPDYYVYVHTRLKDGAIFYVGKGIGDRLRTSEGRNEHWSKIVKADGGFNHQMVRKNLTEDQAFAFEKKLIIQHNPEANIIKYIM